MLNNGSWLKPGNLHVCISSRVRGRWWVVRTTLRSVADDGASPLCELQNRPGSFQKVEVPRLNLGPMESVLL